MPHTLINKSVHPGETIIIPAVLVGGDYGTTVGTVHATLKFISTNHISVPVLETSQQYSQWIDIISVCTDLKYTVYTNHIGQNYTMYLNSSKHLKDVSEIYTQCDKDIILALLQS